MNHTSNSEIDIEVLVRRREDRLKVRASVKYDTTNSQISVEELGR